MVRVGSKSNLKNRPRPQSAANLALEATVRFLAFGASAPQ
jgi:hypothetical protein